MTTTLATWLNSLPPSGFRGTATALRTDLARCLAPGESLPSSRKVARTIGAMLRETKFILRRHRLTRARLIVIEAAGEGQVAA